MPGIGFPGGGGAAKCCLGVGIHNGMRPLPPEAGNQGGAGPCGHVPWKLDPRRRRHPRQRGRGEIGPGQEHQAQGTSPRSTVRRGPEALFQARLTSTWAPHPLAPERPHLCPPHLGSALSAGPSPSAPQVPAGRPASWVGPPSVPAASHLHWGPLHAVGATWLHASPKDAHLHPSGHSASRRPTVRGSWTSQRPLPALPSPRPQGSLSEASLICGPPHVL